MTEMKNEDITVENSSAKMTPKDVATNYVLEKLSKAGIEVVTDKEEFDRIKEQIDEINITFLEMLEEKKLDNSIWRKKRDWKPQRIKFWHINSFSIF